MTDKTCIRKHRRNNLTKLQSRSETQEHGFFRKLASLLARSQEFLSDAQLLNSRVSLRMIEASRLYLLPTLFEQPAC